MTDLSLRTNKCLLETYIIDFKKNKRERFPFFFFFCNDTDTLGNYTYIVIIVIKEIMIDTFFDRHSNENVL